MAESQATHDDFFDSLLGDFLDESGQLLDRLNENLLRLDEWVRSLDEGHHERCDDDLMNEMFRSAHSLKGLSAMLGLTDINHLTHKVENVFDAARKDQLVVSGDVVELMFQAVDRLVSLVDGLKDQEAKPVECESVLEGIQSVLQAAGVERAQTSQADAERALSDTPPSPEVETPASACQAETPAPAPRAEAECPAPQASAACPTPPSETPRPESEVAAVAAPRTRDVFADLRDEVEIPGKYLAIFIDEAVLSLDELTETLLALEGGGSREALESLLITSHRIKGSAASVGLNRAAKLAHLMEDLLQNLVTSSGTLSPELADAMLKCTDGLRHYIEGLRQGRANSDYFDDLARELTAAQNCPRQPDHSRTPAAAPQTTEAKQETRRPATAAEPSTSEVAPASSNGETPQATQSERAPFSGVSEELRQLVAKARPDATTLAGVVSFTPGLPLVGLKARLIFEKLANLGDVCCFDPPVEQVEDVEDLEHLSFGIATEKPIEVVERHLRVAGVHSVAIELVAKAKTEEESPRVVARQETRPAASRTPTREPASASRPSSSQAASGDSEGEASSGVAGSAKGRSADGSSKPTETLRVDIDRLDELMNLAGQLVISKARFSQIADRLKVSVASRQSTQSLNNVFSALDRITNGSAASTGAHLQAELDTLRGQARRIQTDLESIRRDVAALSDVRGAMNDLFEAVHQLDRVSDGIQQSVMSTRMVPIGPLFTRFKRVVRDVTRTNGKQVRLEIYGEKTELDKRMIDELGDPLIHMVRNSADHGIELPDVREAAGKPREGTVTLNAFHRGNCIIIQVTDDGKGLDSDRILQKALEKGLVQPVDVEKLTRQQVFNLIWEPGLSTADKVTEVSGRGMGMDIVKSKIEDLNGSIELDSTPGQGTTITIKLPLTLAILPSLMVEIDRAVYAMPIESVAEIVSAASKDLTTIHGLWAARVRDRVISVVRLGDVFSWSRVERRAGPPVSEETTLVIVGDRGHEIGLAVDRVIGEEDVVIKSVAENYRNVPGISGASILGDGRVSLILDVAALIDMSARKASATATF